MKRRGDRSIVDPTYGKEKSGNEEIPLNQKMEGRFKGVVRKYCAEKKYGFTTGENYNEKTGSEVFFSRCSYMGEDGQGGNKGRSESRI